MEERLIMVANKLPLTIKRNQENSAMLQLNSGGYSSGLKDFYEKQHSIWIGWTGEDKSLLNKKEKAPLFRELKQKNCVPVELDAKEIEYYYYGFSNKTLWPLFHYFTQNAVYHTEYWEVYKAVNEKFADVVVDAYQPGDKIWIHDYHLMLLPALLRKRLPDVSIGFFLHIPFPSYEMFRLLPWRSEVLEGLLGSDLIGFHTYDYERHFMSCVRRLLGYESVFNQIRLEERIVKADNFPMGIDYQRWSEAATHINHELPKNQSIFNNELFKNFLKDREKKIIVSIDRLDYAKGLPDRLRAYEYFLQNHPEYIEKVSLLLFVIPSRDELDDYQDQKREVDELVGRINGWYGVINWIPIWYFYRPLSFEALIEIYNAADIAFLTPTRDGMNLVSKQYAACRTDGTGVVILSEMAGSAKEMGEAILVNPNNRAEIAEALLEAIKMPDEEQKERMFSLQKRLSVYNEDKWANDFMDGLAGVKDLQAKHLTKKINDSIYNAMEERYQKADKRIIFLDYDGTLSPFTKDPQQAGPDNELYKILGKITEDEKNKVVIISGRDKETLSKWFDDSWKITFIAEHGVWYRPQGGKWEMEEKINKDWMESVRPTIQYYVDRTPRTFLEEKNYSLAWHYRKADPDLGTQRSWELKDDLKTLVTNLNLEIMDGDKVIEIKYSGINKGRSALKQMGNKNYDFIIALGDDWTDEYTFEAMPDRAITIKVGTKSTSARYYVEDVANVRNLLSKLTGLK